MLALAARLQVQHDYGGGARDSGLAWQLLGSGALPGHALHLRELDDGVAVYLDDEVDPHDGEVELGMRAADPLFDNYTVGLEATIERVPLFAPRAGQLAMQGHVPRRHAQQRAVLRLPLSISDPLRWTLHLRARATLWKYLLIGDWLEEAQGGADSERLLRVVDTAEQAVRFEAARPEPLADGRLALAIRSTEPIPLQRRAGRRFQLRAQGRGGEERVLIRQLPVAHARSFGREEGGPAGTALVSEIPVLR